MHTIEYQAGYRYAQGHAYRPCLAALARDWGYTPQGALQFAIGFHAGKRDRGEHAETRCNCPQSPFGS